MNLLSTSNIKTKKGEKYGYITYIMSLMPYRNNSKGINICPFASKGCSDACLAYSGYGSNINAQKAKMNRTELFLNDRVAFMYTLKLEIDNIIMNKPKRKKIAIRLNGTSDISFEKFKIFNGKNIFELFPKITFYDYTKNWKRFENELPKNYHLTFSRSETNEDKALELLAKGINVAIVFETLPETYKGFKVINGDENDIRFKDENGVIIGLHYKKVTIKGGGEINKAALTSGFIVTNDYLNKLNQSYLVNNTTILV
jgi:hypothetical protein